MFSDIPLTKVPIYTSKKEGHPLSKYTKYISEAQDLNMTQAAIYNALKDRAFQDTSICWPSRKDISLISKIKKLGTITDNLPQLIASNHIVRIGPLIYKNTTKCNMYWINNGSNSIKTDINQMISELESGAGAVFLKEEMLLTLNTYLKSYQQVYPSEGEGCTPEGGMGVPGKGVGVYPAKGQQNININNIEDKGREEAPPLQSVDNLLAGERKIFDAQAPQSWLLNGLDHFVCELWAMTPKTDAKDWELKGELASFLRQLKKIPSSELSSNRKLILDTYSEHLACHLEKKANPEQYVKKSTFRSIERWFQDCAWDEDIAIGLGLLTKKTMIKKSGRGPDTTYTSMTFEEQEAERQRGRLKAAQDIDRDKENTRKYGDAAKTGLSSIKDLLNMGDMDD